MEKSNLVIVSNEKIVQSGMNFYCDNIDIKSIPEGLNENFKTLLIGRKSKIERSIQIKLKDIILGGNIISFLINVFKTFKKNNTKYLIISISPYTFFAFLILFILRKRIFVYLRSDGYQEYKYISPLFGSFIYHIMFSTVSLGATLLSCTPNILRGKKGHIVYPSQITNEWFIDQTEPDVKKIRLLYIGRIRTEKGIFSLLNIIKDIEKDFSVSLVTAEKKVSHKINQHNINLINFDNKNDSIIKMYDSHSIFILPSLTEGHPQVLDEALARLRPVIIFNEISHVIGKRQGVFISKRNSDSLLKTINEIIKNYKIIQEKISQNTLPTKEKFIKDISLVLNSN